MTLQEEQEMIMNNYNLFKLRFATEIEALVKAKSLGMQWSIIKLRGRNYWQLSRAV